jgi:hypothetical protein
MKISSVLGSPDVYWEGVEMLPDFGKIVFP